MAQKTHTLTLHRVRRCVRELRKEVLKADSLNTHTHTHTDVKDYAAVIVTLYKITKKLSTTPSQLRKFRKFKVTQKGFHNKFSFLTRTLSLSLRLSVCLSLSLCMCVCI